MIDIHKDFLTDFYSKEKNHFKLYSSCIPIKGLTRGAIFDLQKGEIHFIPNNLIELLGEFTNELLFEKYKDQKELLFKYLNYLYENDLIFCTDKPLSFPPISENLNLIHKGIDFICLEIDTLQTYKLDLLKKLDLFGVKQLMLIQSKNQNAINNFKEVLNICEYSKLNGIVLITSDFDNNISNELIEISENNKRVIKLIFYNSNIIENYDSSVIYFNKSLKDVLCKRIDSTNDFVINISSYIEAKNRNLYFNKRVYIDDRGTIKHSFDDSADYGNIHEDNLEKIIISKKFTDLWMVTKDKIEICKDCEFRYVCPDNRIPVKINTDAYEQKTKCNYNSKTTHWIYEK